MVQALRSWRLLTTIAVIVSACVISACQPVVPLQAQQFSGSGGAAAAVQRVKDDTKAALTATIDPAKQVSADVVKVVNAAANSVDGTVSAAATGPNCRHDIVFVCDLYLTPTDVAKIAASLALVVAVVKLVMFANGWGEHELAQILFDLFLLAMAFAIAFDCGVRLTSINAFVVGELSAWSWDAPGHHCDIPH